MREVVYRNLTPPGSRKKDVFVQEIFEKNGVTAKTERRCFYFVKEKSHFDTIDDLREWEDAQTRSGAADKKQFYIFKKHSDASGEDRITCKMLGNFYIVVGRDIYTIAFLHSFKAFFSKKTTIK